MIDETISENKSIKLGDIDIYSESIPYDGVGGDIISLMDFSKLYNLDRIKNIEQKRIDTFIEEAKNSGISMDAEPLHSMYNKYVNRLENIVLNHNRIGIIVGDVMGHGSEDSAIARDLSKWFELAADFDIERYGQITKRAIEKINNMFYKELESNNKKYVTMIYGEIYTDGTFRFVSAGHPKPIIYSKEFGRVIPLPDDIIDPGFPLGLRPSYGINNLETYLGYEPEYHVNTMKLESPGDIFILHTDGLSEHKNLQNIDYHPKEGVSRLEDVLKKTNHLSAKEISNEIKRDLRTYGKTEDDISYVIIKKMV
jgi:serine phosphatase RsbU (regulator of sigma subunit)